MNDLRCLFLFLSLTSAVQAFACDPCALFNSSRLTEREVGSFTASVSEQYTNYSRADNVAENSVRDGEFVTGFSTTQLGLAYDITREIGVQVSIPFIIREFDKVERFRTAEKSDSGLGDMSLVGTYSIYDCKQDEWAVDFGLLGGIKLPTGDTGVIREVSNEESETAVLGHHSIGGASGGRALTFGTGSVDYLFGANFIGRYERFVLLTQAQYTLRTEGAFDYEYADDVLWSVVAAYYLSLEHEATIAAGIAITGELKGKDHLDGALVSGSGVSNTYIGPELLFTVNDDIGVELTADFRITDEDSAALVVPDSRFRASVLFRF